MEWYAGEWGGGEVELREKKDHNHMYTHLHHKQQELFNVCCVKKNLSVTEICRLGYFV